MPSGVACCGHALTQGVLTLHKNRGVADGVHADHRHSETALVIDVGGKARHRLGVGLEAGDRSIESGVAARAGMTHDALKSTPLFIVAVSSKE